MGLPKINVDNRDFVNDAVNQMDSADALEFMPSFFKPEMTKTDMTMHNQMEVIGERTTEILKKVDGTRILAGSEAFTSALTFKRLADTAELAGIQGAAKIAERLRERFAGQGPGKSTDGPTPPPADPEPDAPEA